MITVSKHCPLFFCPWFFWGHLSNFMTLPTSSRKTLCSFFGSWKVIKVYINCPPCRWFKSEVTQLDLAVGGQPLSNASLITIPRHFLQTLEVFPGRLRNPHLGDLRCFGSTTSSDLATWARFWRAKWLQMGNVSSCFLATKGATTTGATTLKIDKNTLKTRRESTLEMFGSSWNKGRWSELGNQQFSMRVFFIGDLLWHPEFWTQLATWEQKC